MFLPLLEAYLVSSSEVELLNLLNQNQTGITCSQVATYIGFYTTFSIGIITLFLLILIGIALERGSKPFSDATLATYVLVPSSFATGVSMASLVASIAILVVLLQTPHVSLCMYVLGGISSLGITLIILSYLLSNVIFLSKNEADVMGGDLTVVSIGILTMSMGFALPVVLAVLPHSIVAEYSNMAGALVGSGLTLIAIGLQRYYEERSRRNCPT